MTDLVLGLSTLSLIPWLRRPDVDRNWRRMLSWAGAGALVGTVHHALLTSHDDWASTSRVVFSGIVVVTISFVLAATVADVLGEGQHVAFWVLRGLGFAVFGVLAALGRRGTSTILISECVTMVSILALWGLALARHHPRAPAMVVALTASAAAGCTRALPSGLTHVVRLDPTSLYHLAQIPAMLLLCFAVTAERVRESGDRCLSEDLVRDRRTPGRAARA